MTQSLSQARGRNYFFLISKIRERWKTDNEKLLRITTLIMSIMAGLWLGYQFFRLVALQSYWGAIDLRVFLNQFRVFFSGISLYVEGQIPPYPPASYLITGPILGWIDFAIARWLWAALYIIALVVMASLIVRESGAESRAERAFMSLLPLSVYATGATVGNGQWIVILLPILLTGILMLRRAQTWRDDLLGAFLILVALVKPSVSVPFFWMVLFLRLRVALIVMAVYIILTLAAAFFQPSAPWVLFANWLTGASGSVIAGGYSDINSWSFALGTQSWNLHLTLLFLLVLGAWAYRHRHADIWVLLGVSATVARFWTYHNWYDDLLLLVPMIALYRIAKRGGPNGRHVIAGVLFALLIPAMLAPGGLYLFPQPLNFIYRFVQSFLWLAMLIFLLTNARNEEPLSNIQPELQRRQSTAPIHLHKRY